MAAAPDHSVPKQHSQWADVKAAYRFLNHPEVSPGEIQRTHREQARGVCLSHSRILAIQDTTELNYTGRSGMKGLGPLSEGHCGLLQHSTLAVTPSGELLGVLHQLWHARVPVPAGETRKQRRARFKESDFWPDSVKAVGSLEPPTRVIHVADRGGDTFEMMEACSDQGVGFLLRAQHDRYVDDGRERLWGSMKRQPIAGTRDVPVPARSSRPARILQPAQEAQPARVARLAVRYALVKIGPPRNDPRFQKARSVWVVYVVEVDPPTGVSAIEWMLLTSEPVERIEQAHACVDWYTHRWVIEEWHKVEKTGCRLEASQLKDAQAIQRLAALTAVVAVRLIQLRDAAQGATRSDAIDSASPSEDPARLQALAPPSWIAVVSHLAGCRPQELTPRCFWWTLAKRGGFLGRRRDGLPGWQTIWKGWYDVMLMAQGLELHRTIAAENTYG